MSQPKNATSAQFALRVSDMKKTVTIEQIEQEIEDVIDTIELGVLALVDHWTDDSGLHQAPFEGELEDAIRESFRPLLTRLALNGGDN